MSIEINPGLTAGAQASVPVPPPAPGTYVPNEVPPITVPTEPGPPPEVDDPTPAEPIIPIREPAINTPPQAV